VGRIAAIGTGMAVRGFGLAGALVLPAEDAHEVRAAWAALPSDVELVILTPAAAQAVGPATDRLVAVLP